MRDVGLMRNVGAEQFRPQDSPLQHNLNMGLEGVNVPLRVSS